MIPKKATSTPQITHRNKWPQSARTNSLTINSKFQSLIKDDNTSTLKLRTKITQIAKELTVCQSKSSKKIRVNARQFLPSDGHSHQELVQHLAQLRLHYKYRTLWENLNSVIQAEMPCQEGQIVCKTSMLILRTIERETIFWQGTRTVAEALEALAASRWAENKSTCHLCLIKCMYMVVSAQGSQRLTTTASSHPCIISWINSKMCSQLSGKTSLMSPILRQVWLTTAPCACHTNFRKWTNTHQGITLSQQPLL
jgi:hypothetical protein